MRKAFTLVELLVVIGIIGLMGSIAIGGYSAVVRGMSDRAALDAAKGIVDIAFERAKLDRKNTYIYLYNEVIKLDSDMSPGIVSGVAIAVRPIGRISTVLSGIWCDEFADLSQTYGSLRVDGEELSEEDAQKAASTLTIYNISAQKSAVVRLKDNIQQSYMDLEESGKWQEFRLCGFEKVSGDASFNVGQEYGQEFSVIRLPPGYVFSKSVSMSGVSNLGQKFVEVKKVNPDNTPSIEVFARRPDGSFESIGKTTDVKDGEQ